VGPKTTRGKYFLNTILDVCSNRGAKYDMGTRILNGGRAPVAPFGDGPVFIVGIRVYVGVQSGFI